MKYVRLKNQEIPPIALGTWSWGNGVNGGDTVFGNNLNDEDLKPVFETAMEAGFNLWDTAAVYGMGASETILGKFIQANNNVLISTKFTPGAQESMDQALTDSLNRLGVDHADIYWIHNPNDVNKWTTKLIPLMKSGKVKHAGVSNHNLEEIKLAASILEKEGLQLSAVQNHYSLLYRSSEEAGIIDWCNQHDVLFFSYMVLEQGALTGKYNAQHPFKTGTRRGEAFNTEVLQNLSSLLEVMDRMAHSHGVDPAQIAIAWSIAKRTVPIIGVTKPKHIEGAISAAKVILTQQEIQALEEAAKATGIEVQAAWEKKMQ
ncbi:aryl-alcohol dehydrogenase-like predicted oxidoreductase [Pullulanibacillus pueri]|uniref:Aldo/keto reductase n=1 Tax=Pullulanibacillus pueri TaxID=1437324 RepID=A0A8J3EP73_9BACL|nr:aldo/keto reductase [Pullulanibacillus pueri]MBM7680993.1 aryl-alcohol dehydrogenase-like predicted oxidoreductase [Pullulanibacillus pueri]GGH86244.1 aldo/keto reductase [Pullulanibacillus pueri]